MYLGLDLRGGVHFLIQVDMEGALRQADERFASDFRSTLREERLRYKSILRRAQGGVRIVFRDAETAGKAEQALRRQFADLTYDVSLEGDEPVLIAQLSEAAERETQSRALQQNITTLRNRINSLGVAEPVIQQQGTDRIVVQLPGVQDTTEAKEILGATATLEFRMVDEDWTGGDASATAKIYQTQEGNPVALKRSVMLTGDYIIGAASTISQDSGQPEVSITLNAVGGNIFSQRTKDQIGRPMATVYREPRTRVWVEDGEQKRESWTEEYVISIATIQDQLGKRFRITGLDSTQEARRLALLLSAGSLAAPIEIVEERTVGPSLGRENVEQGQRSVMLGFILVLIFMLVYYKMFGLVANIALTLNLVLIFAALSALQATLTLPGIAGIVLTVGMAVDANVLIFERIREELRVGNTPQASIHAGYAKAFRDNRRRQHHDVDRRAVVVWIRQRTSQRLRGDLVDRHRDLDVQRHSRHPSADQFDLWGASSSKDSQFRFIERLAI